MTGPCSFQGCPNAVRARSLCPTHWKQWHVHGELNAIGTKRRMPPLEVRFWAKVNKTDDCWLWTAATVAGYGAIGLRGKHIKAHRYSWELANGPIPDGLHVLHRCDNPPCVRPDHLFLGTHADNMADMSAKGRVNSVRGEKNKSAVLTETDVVEIRRLKQAGVSSTELGRRFGVSANTALLITKRKKWSHVA